MIYIFFISVFFITLQSFYFPLVGSGLTYLGYTILFLMSLSEYKMRKDSLNFSLVSIIIFSTFGCFLIVFSNISFSDAKSFFALLGMLIVLPFLVKFFESNKKTLNTILAWVLIIHVSILIIQVIYWIFSREYLDLMLAFTGEKSGSMSKKGLMLLGERVPRFSGLFNEPGTYSVVTMSLVFIYYCRNVKVDTLLVLSALSCLATMSAFGVVLVMMLVMLIAITNNHLRVKLLITTIVIFILFFLVGGYESILNRFSSDSDYSGLDFRAKMIHHYLENFNNIFLGMRIEGMPDFFVPNDIGLWFSFVVSMGAAGWVFIISSLLFLYYKVRRVDVVCILAFILLTKLKFTYPLFWLLYALLLTIENKKNATKK